MRETPLPRSPAPREPLGLQREWVGGREWDALSLDPWDADVSNIPSIYFFILPPIANKAGRHPARPVPGRTRLKKRVSALQFLFKLSDSNQGPPEQNHLQGLSQRTDPHGTTAVDSL